MTKENEMPTTICPMERAARIADMYSKENFLLATDTILLDPVLKGNIDKDSVEESDNQQMWGCIYSSRAHAAKDIAAAIREELCTTSDELRKANDALQRLGTLKTFTDASGDIEINCFGDYKQALAILEKLL